MLRLRAEGPPTCGPGVHVFPDISLFTSLGDSRDARKIPLGQWVGVSANPEVARKAVAFPVDFPFSGNFLETIPAPTASTAIPLRVNT